MALKSDYSTQECSIARALEVVGERWTLLIVRDCFLGLRRFSDFQRHLGIPKAVLTVRLERLVEAGILERHEYRPGRHEYQLVRKGLDLWPALHALNTWGNQNLAPNGARSVFLHAECGDALVAGGFCANCRRLPAATEIEYQPGPGRAPDPDDPVEQALRPGHRLLEPLVLA
ncbi:helix-turn-helix transcriptional regulator [Amycolatopsis acidiphila]|uniref:Helix-turn-helix transcriptional regulator n=1 Tax=Amycolatopsis acidiphila TaxID=715473 RepID=A0A558ABZ1_9PSEU|nr:helix-turn-helix domain-containing protein [Amycolatopsis acidiphila]TVT21763.1 helix-turn-helix transcriptional regulator [Amycolatopsis acidiphila]UIJ61476.1 helix-turn-helix transcriptional regulator [Amycolatopsis acidiphila]GHG59702.1 ArsR family transcriptional regulator [Amycolatopsis acidiphila]